jgi:catechol 2,3-dioxygenase-like lactoylglutathione lyase family enzyme
MPCLWVSASPPRGRGNLDSVSTAPLCPERRSGAVVPQAKLPAIDLNNPRLLVLDFERSWKFYTKTLGLPPVSGNGTPPYGEVGTSERFVGIFLRAAMDDLLGPALAGAAPRDAVSLIFEVPDVDERFEALRGADVEILIAPTDRPLWGLRTLHLRDPDGNLVELYTRLAPPPKAKPKRATGSARRSR